LRVPEGISPGGNSRQVRGGLIAQDALEKAFSFQLNKIGGDIGYSLMAFIELVT
jgi:hypothetical protein